ncbi:MAG TPA: M50 family metallopeptidase [Candidatus Paceibacterota bacterium]|nr:M50 family metallopeptidase [Candidatus Paceibacterota bacterium]
MLIIILVIIGLSFLILGHEAGHFFVAKMFGLKVDEFGIGFPPRIVAKKFGDTEYSINWLPFGGFVRISGERGEFEGISPEEGSPGTGATQLTMTNSDKARLFYNQPAWKKSAIVLAGVFMNFILGWLLIAAVFMIGVPQTLVISATEAGSPAAAAGLQAGDVIKGYADSQSFINYVDANKGQPITVTIIRDDKTISFMMTPRVNAPANQGALGVALEDGGAARENPFKALWDGLEDAAIISWLTLQAFYDLLKQIFVHASIPADVVGPVGIFGIAEETGKIGLAYLLQFLGIISINLMIVNCIPFPALDGGRFLMVLIEKIKGSALSYKVEATVNGVGFALLLTLMVVLTVRDIHGLL